MIDLYKISKRFENFSFSKFRHWSAGHIDLSVDHEELEPEVP